MKLRGELRVPGDKSISHRAVLLASIAKGRSRITNFLFGSDCLATVNAMRQMGIEIEKDNLVLNVQGEGLRGLKAPGSMVDLENSGTSIRLLLGVLAGQDFEAELTGDDSLKKRPMKRVIDPLSQMGANIRARDNNFPPVNVLCKDRALKGIRYESPVASAQVKSAVLLAGLYAEGKTSVSEPFISRDHTERMFSRLGVRVEREGKKVTIGSVDELPSFDIDIPGDISSAAFFIAGAAVLPGSDIIIKNVGLNPTRLGFLDILKRMGADIEVLNINDESYEPCGDVRVKSSRLNGIEVTAKDIPFMIDEIPVFAVAASLADGDTRITGAGELRLKESDRLETIASNLRKLGVLVEEMPEGLVIHGAKELKGGSVNSFGDHRIAMAMEIASLAAEDKVEVEGKECVAVSFPQFYDLMRSVIA